MTVAGDDIRVYELNIDAASATLESRVALPSDWKTNRPPALVDLYAQNKVKRLARKESGKTQALHGKPVKWADFSPDCQLTFIAYGSDPELVRDGEVGRRAPWSSIKEFDYRASPRSTTPQGSLLEPNLGSTIEDVTWSADSRYLVLIERESRRANSVAGIVSALVGSHPDLRYTFVANIFDTVTNESRKVVIASDLPYSVVVLSGGSASCSQ